jgi:hypothetical protein
VPGHFETINLIRIKWMRSFLRKSSENLALLESFVRVVLPASVEPERFWQKL